MDYDYYEKLEKLYEIFGVQISRLLIYCFKKGVCMQELVIKIDDEEYHKIKQGRGSVKVMEEVIKKAMPLPWSMQVLKEQIRINPPTVGIWIVDEEIGGVRCNLCGHLAQSTEVNGRYKVLWELSNYCPGCGSKMIKSEVNKDATNKNNL